MIQVNKTREAIALAAKVSKKYPSSSFTFCILGKAWQQLGNKSEATRSLRIALQLDPVNAEAKRELDKLGM